MARFVQPSITRYDDSGIPDLGAAERQWINLDQVESIKEVVTDTFFHSVRYDPGFYPHLLLTLASGRELVTPLGQFATTEEANTALNDVVSTVLITHAP